MACCDDNTHPKPVAACIFRLLNCIYFVVGVGLIVLGAIMITKMPKGKGFPIVILVVGAVTVAAAFLGLIGAKFGSLSAGSCTHWTLQFFFLFSLVATVFLLTVGFVLLLSADSIEGFIITQYDDIMDNIDDSESLRKDLDGIVKNTNILGGVSVGAGALVLLGFILCCYLMGVELFLRTTILYGSLVLAAVGLLTLIVALIFLVVAEAGAQTHTGLLIAYIIFGAVLIFIGLDGFFHVCCMSTCCVYFFVILIFIAAVAGVAFAIVSFAISDTVYDDTKKESTEKCAVTDQTKKLSDSSCSAMIEAILTYLCDSNLTSGSNKLAKDCTPDSSVPESCKCRPLAELPAAAWPPLSVPFSKQMAKFAQGVVIVMGGLGVGIFLLSLFLFIIALILCCCPCGVTPRRHGENDSVRVNVGN